MAEGQSTSGQGRELLLDTGEEFPEHVRQHSIVVGKYDDQEISNPLGNLGASPSPIINALGVNFTQNESPVPGPSFEAQLQTYSEHQYYQDAPTTYFDGNGSPQHMTSQPMEGILDQNYCLYGESPHHRIADTEATHHSLEMAPLGPSYGEASNDTPNSPFGYDLSPHPVSTPSTTMSVTIQTDHSPDHPILPSTGWQTTSTREDNDGDNHPPDDSIASVDAEDMDIDEEASGDTLQCPWELAQDYPQDSSSTSINLSPSEPVLYSPIHTALTYLPQHDTQNNAAASQTDDPSTPSTGFSTALPNSANAQGILSVPHHSTTQAETDAIAEGISIDMIEMANIFEPHYFYDLDVESLLQDPDELVFGPALQTQSPTSVETEHSAALAEGTNLALQQSDAALISWSSQNGIYVPGLAPLPSLQANMAELGDLYDIDEDFERNHDVCEFFEYWRFRFERMKTPQYPDIGVQAMELRHSTRPKEVSIEDLDERHCDYQGIDWPVLGAVREEARTLRKRMYVNYTNIQNPHPSAAATDLPNTDNHFRFRRMTSRHKAHLSHFQLRNIVSATSKNAVYYASRSKIICADPTLGTEQAVMDFTKPSRGSENLTLQKISTMTASEGVLIAGGFGGEYAMMSLSANYDSALTSGLITDNYNGITNHIHICRNRRSGSPLAVFSSNDDHIRVLDCNTNTFVKQHKYPFPINCAATSPDSRLRLLVGDHCHPWVVDAESGERIVRLHNHRDYGFACAWADDGIHIATGNQDGVVQVWDARHLNRPLQTIGTTMGGVRSMRFSPVGSGKRVLLMAEPADIISVVDAVTFQSTQRFDFFGEIGGVGFVPDGETFFVANTDANFGGLLEFERIGFGERYGVPDEDQSNSDREGEGEGEGRGDYDWRPDAELDDDGRAERTEGHRRRRGLDLHSVIF